MSLITPSPDPNVKTIRDLLPIHEHPPAAAINSIHKVAKQQMRDAWAALDSGLNSNARAKYLRDRLTPEQLYIYEWISYMFIILALPYETFARQIGVKESTLRGWLRKDGHIPVRIRFRRLLSIYEANFCDELAAQLLHGDKIGQWREKHRSMSEIVKEKWREAGYKVD